MSRTGRTEYQLLLMKASDRGRNVKFLGNNFGCVLSKLSNSIVSHFVITMYSVYGEIIWWWCGWYWLQTSITQRLTGRPLHRWLHASKKLSGRQRKRWSNAWSPTIATSLAFARSTNTSSRRLTPISQSLMSSHKVCRSRLCITA